MIYFFRVHDIHHFVHSSFADTLSLLHWQWPIYTFPNNSLSINCILHYYQIIIYHPLSVSITDLIWHHLPNIHKDTWNLQHQNTINYQHRKQISFSLGQQEIKRKRLLQRSFKKFQFLFGWINDIGQLKSY